MSDPVEKKEEMRVRATHVGDLLQKAGGILDGAARDVANQTGVSEAAVYGVGSFFHLLASPNTKMRICQGLSCRMKGATEMLIQAEALGLPVEGCSCLAACDLPVAVLKERETLPTVNIQEINDTQGDWKKLRPGSENDAPWQGIVGPLKPEEGTVSLDLTGVPDYSGSALLKSASMGADTVIEEIKASGLQGRGGAGFPASIKWNAVRAETFPIKYVVLNADEGEPGTFKDREVLLRRPDKVIEGLAIAARTVGASDIYCYLRGEFGGPWKAMEAAIAIFEEKGLLDGLNIHLHAGHGAYICGEETALLEALEGKRGMPRNKPPFPTQHGLWGRPTLIHNVETIACVPSIMERGGQWFHDLGRVGPGSKLYCVSGDVVNPGTYELPLGVTLDELVEVAGGYVGELKAFSPGGASSGFLPPAERGRPLDFKSLSEVGAMLGSAGVVVLNSERNLIEAVRTQLGFFEEESCGQCAPCRIGTRLIAKTFDKMVEDHDGASNTPWGQHIDDISWEMAEGSICGLGQAAFLPLTSMLKWFPDEVPS